MRSFTSQSFHDLIVTLLELGGGDLKLNGKILDGAFHSGSRCGVEKGVETELKEVGLTVSTCEECLKFTNLNNVSLSYWLAANDAIKEGQKRAGTPISSLADLMWRYNLKKFPTGTASSGSELRNDPTELSPGVATWGHDLGRTLRADITLSNMSDKALKEFHLSLLNEIFKTPKPLESEVLRNGAESFQRWVESYANELESSPNWFLVKGVLPAAYKPQDRILEEFYRVNKETPGASPTKGTLFLAPEVVLPYLLTLPVCQPFRLEVLETETPLTFAVAEAFRVIYSPYSSGVYSDEMEALKAAISL